MWNGWQCQWDTSSSAHQRWNFQLQKKLHKTYRINWINLLHLLECTCAKETSMSRYARYNCCFLELEILQVWNKLSNCILQMTLALDLRLISRVSAPMLLDSSRTNALCPINDHLFRIKLNPLYWRFWCYIWKWQQYERIKSMFFKLMWKWTWIWKNCSSPTIASKVNNVQDKIVHY